MDGGEILLLMKSYQCCLVSDYFKAIVLVLLVATRGVWRIGKEEGEVWWVSSFHIFERNLTTIVVAAAALSNIKAMVAVRQTATRGALRIATQASFCFSVPYLAWIISCVISHSLTACWFLKQHFRLHLQLVSVRLCVLYMLILTIDGMHFSLLFWIHLECHHC